MNKKYFDFHTHTSRSDAAPSQTPAAVVKAAAEAGLRHLLITDHDRALPDDLRLKLSQKYGIHVIGGCEFNGAVTLSTGRRINAHIIVPWLDPASPAVTAVLKQNQEQDFEGYCKEMLRKLLALGIDPSGSGIDASWEMLKEANPDTLHLGKNAVAHLLADTGFSKSPRESKDIYLSGFGRRLAYVSSDLFHHYASLEDVMAAANGCSLAILAHLYYYQLSEAENEELLTRFKELGGIGLEVDYGNYSEERKAHLAELAKKYGFLPSAASDRHEAGDPFKLGNPEWYEALREKALALHHGQLAADMERRI